MPPHCASNKRCRSLCSSSSSSNLRCTRSVSLRRLCCSRRLRRPRASVTSNMFRPMCPPASAPKRPPPIRPSCLRPMELKVSQTFAYFYCSLKYLYNIKHILIGKEIQGTDAIMVLSNCYIFVYFTLFVIELNYFECRELKVIFNYFTQ